MRAKHAERQRALRLERLRRAIGGRTSFTPLEVFVGLGYPAHLFDRRTAEKLREALVEFGYAPTDTWSLPAERKEQ